MRRLVLQRKHFAHHHLAQPGLVPAAAHDVHIGAQFASHPQQGADIDVDVGIVLPRQVDDGHHFERSQRLADARLELDVLKLRPNEVAHQFRIGPLAEHHDAERVAGRHERHTQAVDQGQNRQQHGHGKRDSERGHQSGGLANHQVPQVVREGDGHEN